MMKIVVFDCGWGGDAFADFLEREMPVVEVVRVIEWREGLFSEKTEEELRKLAERALECYIGRVDAIVLASYEVTVACLKYLRFRYPEQIFVGMSWPALRGKTERVAILTTNLVRRSQSFRKTRRRLPEKTTVMVCDGWMQLLEDGELHEQKIKHDSVRIRRMQPQVVVLGCTNLVDVRELIEKTCPMAFVADGYGATMRNLCRLLKIRGMRVDRW